MQDQSLDERPPRGVARNTPPGVLAGIALVIGGAALAGLVIGVGPRTNAGAEASGRPPTGVTPTAAAEGMSESQSPLSADLPHNSALGAEGAAGVLLAELTDSFEGYVQAEYSGSKAVREFELVAAESRAELFTGVPEMDGVQTRVWAYNGQVPGPELRIQLGETVRATLVNDLPVDTTIHWHGVRVPNAMDGVPGITQEPVGPGERFVYEFTPPEPGTYWYHPHVRSSEEIERGLYGVLVVEDPAEPQYSQDVVWILDDWLIQEDGQIYPEFNAPRDLMHDGRWGNFVTVNSVKDQVLKVSPGERLRVRLVNTANGRVFAPDFSSLEPMVVAYDGILVDEPFPLELQELAPGNRMDVELRVPAEPTADRIEVFDKATRQEVRLAILEISGDAVTTPDFEPPSNAYGPDWTAAAQLEPIAEMVLSARQGGELGIEWLINGRAYPSHESVYLPHAKFSKVVLVNESGRLHPIHLHGQFFRVLSRNGSLVSEGFWRDTVLVYPREVVEIGLVPIDRGSWATHCHILEHAEAGMMTVAEVR